MKETIVTLFAEKDTLSFTIQNKSDDNTLFNYLIEQLKRALCGEEKPDGMVFIQPMHEKHIDNLEHLREYLAKKTS